MRALSTIIREMDRQGRYLDRTLRPAKLNKMSWVEFRQIVKTVDRLMVNLADFNALHFRPSSLWRRKRPIRSKAA